MGLQLLRDVMAAGAGAKHKGLAALPPFRVLEIAGMNLGARESVKTGKIRGVRNAAHARREYQVARRMTRSLPSCWRSVTCHSRRCSS